MAVAGARRVSRPAVTVGVRLVIAVIAAAGIGPPTAAADSGPPTTPTGWQALTASTGCAGDGNLSVRLDAGRVLWLTGDACGGAHNTATLVAGGSATLRPLFLAAAGTDWRWPASAQLVGSVLTVYASRIALVPPPCTSWCFHGVAMEALAYQVPATGWPVLTGITTVTTLVDDASIHWGAGVHGDWLFGTARRAGQFGQDVFVRAGGGPPTQVIDATVTGGTDTAMTVWQDSIGWHFLSKLGGGWGTEIGRWDAPGPTGPWTYTRWLGSPPTEYLIHAHPDIPLADGGLLVTANEQNQPPVFTELPPARRHSGRSP